LIYRLFYVRDIDDIDIRIIKIFASHHSDKIIAGSKQLTLSDSIGSSTAQTLQKNNY